MPTLSSQVLTSEVFKTSKVLHGKNLVMLEEVGELSISLSFLNSVANSFKSSADFRSLQDFESLAWQELGDAGKKNKSAGLNSRLSKSAGLKNGIHVSGVNFPANHPSSKTCFASFSKP